MSGNRGQPQAIIELRQKLADIRPSLEAGSISQLQAEHYALLAVIGALADLDPRLLGEGHLRCLEMLSSRLFDLERRAARPKGKRGRGSVDSAVEEVRCTAIAAKGWLVERFSFPHDKAAAHVRACLNANEAFLSVHRGEVDAVQFENWCNKWLHEQPLSSDLKLKGISIPARSEIVRAVAREMSDSERPPLETVSAFLTAMCLRLPPPGLPSPSQSRIK